MQLRAHWDRHIFEPTDQGAIQRQSVPFCPRASKDIGDSSHFPPSLMGSSGDQCGSDTAIARVGKLRATQALSRDVSWELRDGFGFPHVVVLISTSWEASSKASS